MCGAAPSPPMSSQVTVEFDCDVEGDGDDGWQDDLEDESDEGGAQQVQQEGEGGEVDEEDLDGPGKNNDDACSFILTL